MVTGQQRWTEELLDSVIWQWEASGSDENTPPTAPDAPRDADGRGYGSQAGREADGATGGHG